MTQLEKGIFLYRRSFSLLNLMHVKIWDYNACHAMGLLKMLPLIYSGAVFSMVHCLICGWPWFDSCDFPVHVMACDAG